MAYHIELHAVNVEPYLAESGPFSPAVRALLHRHIDTDLAEHGDFYRHEAHYRIAETPFFKYDLILRDPDTGKLRGFYFVVSDEAAAVGVLRVIYLDQK